MERCSNLIQQFSSLFSVIFLPSYSFGLSDTIFLFPGTSTNSTGSSSSNAYLGEHIEVWEKRAGTNAFHERVTVHKLETRLHSEHIVLGTLTSTTHKKKSGSLILGSTVLLPSSSLPYFRTTLQTLYQSRVPAVFHTLARTVTETSNDNSTKSLRTSTDHTELIRIAQSTGNILLVSGTLQEAHDFSIVSQDISLRTKAPVIHAIDNSTLFDSTGTVRVLRYHELASYIRTVQKETVHVPDTTSFEQSIQRSLVRSANLFTQSYADAFEYTGHNDPLAVIVAIGTGAKVLNDVATYLSVHNNARVGVLRVRMVLPWLTELFLHSLPLSVQRIATVSFLASHETVPTASTWLYEQVTRSVQSLKRSVTVNDWISQTDGVFVPAHAALLLSRIETGGNNTNNNFGTGKLILTASGFTNDDNSTTLPDLLLPIYQPLSSTKDIQRIRIWGLGHDNTANMARNSTRLLSPIPSASDESICNELISGTFAHGPVTVSTIVTVMHGDQLVVPVQKGYDHHYYGSTVGPHIHDGIDMIVVSHLALTEAFNIFEPLQQDGIVVLNNIAVPSNESSGTIGSTTGSSSSPKTASTVEETVASLPAYTKWILANKQAQIYILDTATIASTFNLVSHEDLILQTALFITRSTKSFQRLVPFLESQHRQNLPSDKHGILVRLYATLRQQLNQSLVIPSEWSNLKTNKPHSFPYYPVPTLSSLINKSTNLVTSGSISHGIGPTEYLSVLTKPLVSSSLLSTTSTVSPSTQAKLPFVFPEAYHTQSALIPAEEGVYTGTVTENRRLTPLDYDRNVFHLEIDIQGTGLSYQIGSALGVYAENNEEDINKFLSFYKLDGNQLVTFPTVRNNQTYRIVQSIFRVFQQDLDIFGKPTKDFYETLAKYATDPQERSNLVFLGSDAGIDAFKAREDEGITYAEILYDFPSAHPSLDVLLTLIPRIKARHYSIASSMKAHPHSVHLLVVEVEWITPQKRQRYGQCSHYLANVSKGTKLAISVLPSEMHLPEDSSAPIIMAGLGTGMAPFRAFIQERAYLKSQGVPVGPMILYFGSRFRSKEYLYGDELETYQKQGLLTLRLAFSRDTAKKVYIQHLMVEDTALLCSSLLTQRGNFYLCGPTWPEPDVEEAITQALSNDPSIGGGGVSRDEAKIIIRNMKDNKRYVLEVY